MALTSIGAGPVFAGVGKEFAELYDAIGSAHSAAGRLREAASQEDRALVLLGVLRVLNECRDMAAGLYLTVMQGEGD